MTPNKIQRLLNLAEDRSFQNARLREMSDDDMKRIAAQIMVNKSTFNCESSSGILDLERVEAFGESVSENISLSKSTAFNPGEMTGRSTGADEINSKTAPINRHSVTLDSITNKMNRQTLEVQDIMRHSIASEFSFQSKRDLSADEESLIRREAPLPIQQTQAQFPDSISMDNSNLSVGAYFKYRCPDFARMLGKTDSPDRSAFPSVTEASTNASSKIIPKNLNTIMDNTLDSVPVRQPRETNIEKQSTNRAAASKTIEKASFKIPLSCDKNKEVPSAVKLQQQPTYNMQGSVTLNPGAQGRHKGIHSAMTPTDVLIKNLHASLKLTSDETDELTENSFSISKIADYLGGKHSNVSVSELLQNYMKKQPNRKSPLTELQMNKQESKYDSEPVTLLKDTKKGETASSTASVSTVITLDNVQQIQKQIPEVIITNHTVHEMEMEDMKNKRLTRSRSPSSKSQSTIITVQEKSSFKSGDSPIHPNKGEPSTSHAPSPNSKYKELDKSVDWHEVMQLKLLKREALAKEQWAEITTSLVHGFVGVSCAITITITTKTENWLTAKFKFDDLPNGGKDLNIELPRLPLLLSPGKSEQFTLHITSNVEIEATLPFTIYLKDAAIDSEVEQKGNVDINIQMPVVQAVSCDGMNMISFQPIQEKCSLVKSFVLVSESQVDLQLDMSIAEGESMFAIKNVQEIKRSDINKVLLDRQGSNDETQGKTKTKGMNKQLFRLASGNAIRVTIKFIAPVLSELKIADPIVTFNGALHVNLIGVNTVLRRVDLIGIVGTVKLVVNAPNRLQLTKEAISIKVQNAGSIPGTWIAKLRSDSSVEIPFKVAPSNFELQPGGTKTVNLNYDGAEGVVCNAKLIFEETASFHQTSIEISGGTEKPKTFPIKTNFNIMSWVRGGRKELSLKNSLNKRIQIRCQVFGEGFSVDLPRGDNRGIYSLTFGPMECRPLPIIFSPTTNHPQAGMLNLMLDKNSDYSRKVKLFACASGENMRWSGLVTYGDTALVRAVTRMPINLELYNKSAMPTFVCARVHFNLQYMSVSKTASWLGDRCVVKPRSRHTVSLQVDWAQVERRARDTATATALATVTLLTGHEYTRRRILRVLRNNTSEGLDTSILPDHLKVLAGQFEGEDSNMDNFLKEFEESKVSILKLNKCCCVQPLYLKTNLM